VSIGPFVRVGGGDFVPVSWVVVGVVTFWGRYVNFCCGCGGGKTAFLWVFCVLLREGGFFSFLCGGPVLVLGLCRCSALVVGLWNLYFPPPFFSPGGELECFFCIVFFFFGVALGPLGGGGGGGGFLSRGVGCCCFFPPRFGRGLGVRWCLSFGVSTRHFFWGPQSFCLFCLGGGGVVSRNRKGILPTPAELL